MRVECPWCFEELYGIKTDPERSVDGKVYVIDGTCPRHGPVSGEATVAREEDGSETAFIEQGQEEEEAEASY